MVVRKATRRTAAARSVADWKPANINAKVHVILRTWSQPTDFHFALIDSQ